MKVVWTDQAIADRRAIYDYIDADNPRAAAELDARFTAVADSLGAHPYLGRPGRILGTRERVAHRRYLLLYDIADDTVSILTVVHTSRRWPPMPVK